MLGLVSHPNFILGPKSYRSAAMIEFPTVHIIPHVYEYAVQQFPCTGLGLCIDVSLDCVYFIPIKESDQEEFYRMDTRLCCGVTTLNHCCVAHFSFVWNNLLSAGLRWQDPGWCVQTESLWRLGCHLGCVIMCLSVCSTQLFKSTQFLKSTQLCLPIKTTQLSFYVCLCRFSQLALFNLGSRNLQSFYKI